MEQSNWSAAMLSLQMLKYYCRLSKRMKKRKQTVFNRKQLIDIGKGRGKLLKTKLFIQKIFIIKSL